MTEARRPLTDPTAMRALAHPARLAILARLHEGPCTATEVAEVVGITPSAASYHLRMLAKYGFVEDAPARGDGRERLWRHNTMSLTVSPEPDDLPEVRSAKELLIKVWRDQAASEATRALENYDRESPEWREASAFTSTTLLVDAEEMKWLSERIDELLGPYRSSVRDRDQIPAGARIAEAQVNLFARVVRRPHGLPEEGSHRVARSGAGDG
ncbi:ArsR/SmtB family transcription factor [Streptosporangium lutulentum]|uniref:DNA-binding transcriptional ArsR family regulator n=1 Tax=Streptosporangium lutulentum TaxID=1461250 RepID=A0ABT9QGY6_9ACTN|nr:winged helix-turn-helix domain-containing protein [Streptosporangium lutulentum]MDP9846025.1 DNA-binding transcriptional ArsR family regulator [Streptosporangium lutulentum]